MWEEMIWKQRTAVSQNVKNKHKAKRKVSATHTQSEKY
jgi:hypothetical protein